MTHVSFNHLLNYHLIFKIEDSDESCEFEYVLDVVVHATQGDIAAAGLGTLQYAEQYAQAT